MNDKELIAVFVQHLERIDGTLIRIDSFPDDDNRKSRDIDALAGQYAIEHTSIDSIPKQREDDSYFVRALGGLESEIH